MMKCAADCQCGRHPNGRGTGYVVRHARIYQLRGKASSYSCARCPAQAAEWAQIHTEDGSDPWADYVALCRSCHKTYDLRGRVLSAEARENIAAALRGKPKPPEVRAKISRSLRGNTNRRRT